MTTLTEEQIREIADSLDCGLRSFWHKNTGELLFIPDLNDNPYVDTELFEDDLEKLNNSFGDFIEIEKPQSNDSFEIMADFTEQVDNNKLKNELINALNKKKPFREFKFVIDNSGIYRQEWFDFKSAKLKQWVLDRFQEATHYNERENNSL